MADLTLELNKYHETIQLRKPQKDELRGSREAVREKIRKYFRETLKEEVPKFYQQGSFAMGTTINPMDGEYDIDDGVYFQNLDKESKEKWVTPATAHDWIAKAVEDHTDEKPIDKDTCVRVIYKGTYHVDLPSYGTYSSKYYLSHKKNGWVVSDPKEITDWFKKQVGQKGEDLRTVVRLMKGWADYQKSKIGKMPSGLAITILVTENFNSSDRLDKCFQQTIKNISDKCAFQVHIVNPVDPSEIISSRMSHEMKERFQKAIRDFAIDAGTAIAQTSKKEGSLLWRKHLGERFPEADDPDEKKKSDVRKIVERFSSTATIKPWANTDGFF